MKNLVKATAILKKTSQKPLNINFFKWLHI